MAGDLVQVAALVGTTSAHRAALDLDCHVLCFVGALGDLLDFAGRSGGQGGGAHGDRGADVQVEVQIQVQRVELGAPEHGSFCCGRGNGSRCGCCSHTHTRADDCCSSQSTGAGGWACARLVNRVARVDVAAELAHTFPFRALALGQAVQVGAQRLERCHVLALGINFHQFGVDRKTRGVAAQRFFEDFLGLQVTAIGQVHVGFGDRIDITTCIELAGRIGQRRSTRGGVGAGGIHALAATGAKE